MIDQSSEAQSPYQDPELIEQAAGDRQYLDRLVALRIAEHALSEDPKNPSFQAVYAVMKEEVERFEQG